ncbi:hypothetical protein Tco_0574073, partial [Tanacetum coccineum]
YDQILEDDFAIASRGEEIDLTFFPVAPGPYVIPYPFDGDSSPLYTKQQWDVPHLLENNILCKEIFKDSDVCRKALDKTITPAELRRTKSLIPLELSNRVNILNALLVSHGMELNTRYTNLVASKARTKEKLKRKSGYLKELRFEENKELRSQNDVSSEELKSLQAQLADAKALFRRLIDELARTDAKLSDQALVVRNLQNELALERLLSSDEFHAALARVASLGIAFERGCVWVAKFEVAAQNVSNFFIGAEAEFNKALATLPSTLFPFLGKIAATAEGALSEVTHILLDKLVCLVAPVSTVPPIVSEALDQAPIDHASDDSPSVV